MISKKQIFMVLVFMGILICSNGAWASGITIDATGRVRIDPVLNLVPQASAPANPSEGDIYYTTTKQLLLFSNGRWEKLFVKINYTYSWALGAWTPCSSDCRYDRGSQTRSVICKRSDGVLVVESYCSASPMPTKERTCYGTETNCNKN